MIFAEAAKKNAALKYTENGALALNTTGDALLDLFGTIGSLRQATEPRIKRLFEEAWAENPLLTTKMVFYGRDVRGGLGERRVFRVLIRYMAEKYPEALRPNLDLIGVYGRYDDLYSLMGTSLEEEMWKVMKDQLEEDIRNSKEGKAVSLLAKWIKSPSNRNKEAHRLGKITAEKMGYTEYTFKRVITALRRHIGVLEIMMAEKRWNEIKYPEVPSRAMMIYRRAFEKHDEQRFRQFVNKAAAGEETIHAGTLYPYDLIEKLMPIKNYSYTLRQDPVIDAQWSQLPDYTGCGANAIVMADTSGSMFGRPLYSAIGLAIYFAERNKGAYQNLWMTFSNQPKMQVLKGKTLSQKLSSLDMGGWTMNTNLEAAFQLILAIAIENHVAPEDMPQSLIVVSDMEIDSCASGNWLFYDQMKALYRRRGYEIPNVVFWNVNSRHDTFHADASRKGVQLCSGQSASTFRVLMGSIGMTPVEMMLNVLNDERYAPITIG